MRPDGGKRTAPRSTEPREHKKLSKNTTSTERGVERRPRPPRTQHFSQRHRRARDRFRGS